MPIVCWGNLTKAADDTTKIEQAIEDYISGHQQDPNAHMAAGYSLGDHRGASLLDHALYSIRNMFTYPQVRTYKAIVDPAGYGDLTTIQAAMDYVESLGGGNILIKAGTYVLDSDLEIPSNIVLVGEGPNLTILDFDGNAANVKIQGTYDDEEEIEWGITSGTKIITGVGTHFTQHAQAGQYFSIYYCYYRIASVDSDEQITLEETYYGPTRSGVTAYSVYEPILNAGLANLQVANSAGSGTTNGSGIYITRAVDCVIDNVKSIGHAYYGIYHAGSQNNLLRRVVCTSNANDGFYILSGSGIGIIDCYAFGNADNGFQIGTAQPSSIEIIGCEAMQNGGHGFEFNGSTYGMIANCIADYNSGDGVRTTSYDYIAILQVRANHNAGYGFNISSQYNNQCIVLGCIGDGNDTGEFNDTAPDTLFGHNAAFV